MNADMAEEGLPVNILGGQFEQDVVPFGSTFSNADLENYLKIHGGEFNLSDYGGFGEIEEAVNRCNALYANDTLDLKRRLPEGEFCETVFDSISCWPPTQLNDTAVVRCFSELNGIRYNDTHNATRLCFENGTWSKSNYLSCEEIMDPRSHDVITTTTIYIIGYSLSLVALAVAIYIFLSFKDLKCLRNTIHTNLMCAYGFVYTLWILTLIFELNFESHIACVILIILLHYFHLTTFFWMFVEGLYLYILVVETLTRENFKLRVYSFIGWVLPIFFVIIWAVVKSFLPVTDGDSSSTLAEDVGAVNLWTHCPWMRPHWVDWIHQSPTVLVLLLNLVFLASIMWVLITKLRSANTLETQQYRKAAKALLVLMPLLGITYVLTIAGPTSGDSSKMIFDYARAVLLSTQGFTVALFYCFLNTEVQNTVKHHFDTWRTSRSLGQNHLRTGSRSKDWSPRSRTESIRLYSQPTYHKRESCTSEVTTTTLVTVNGGGRSSSNGGAPTVRSPFLHPPRPSYPGNV